MATTEERMMIMGLCLQGILANPNHSTPDVYDQYESVGLFGGQRRLLTAQEKAQQIIANVELAHRYADRLMPPPPAATDAEKIKRLTVTAYEVLRAAGELEGHDEPWGSGHADEDEVFDAVRFFYSSPEAAPASTALKLVRAVVQAGRFLDLPPAVDPNQPDMFTGPNG